jgi:hypothetical protein
VAEEKFLTLLPCSAKVSNRKLSDAEAESTAPRGKNNKITRLRGIEASQYTSRGNQQSEQDDHDIYPTRLSQEDRQISARWIAKTFLKKINTNLVSHSHRSTRRDRTNNISRLTQTGRKREKMNGETQ